MNRQLSISDSMTNALNSFKKGINRNLDIDDVFERCVDRIQSLMVSNESELFNISRDLESYKSCLKNLLSDSKAKKSDENNLDEKSMIKKTRNYISILEKQNEKKEVEKKKITQATKSCLEILKKPASFTENIEAINSLCKEYSAARKSLSKKIKNLEDQRDILFPRLFEAEDYKDSETIAKLKPQAKGIESQLSAAQEEYRNVFEKELAVRQIKIYLTKISTIRR